MPPHRSESRELEEVEAKEEVVEEKEKENGVEIAPRVSFIVTLIVQHLIIRDKACSNAYWKKNTCYNFRNILENKSSPQVTMRQKSSTPKTRRDNRLSYIDNEIKVLAMQQQFLDKPILSSGA